MFARILASRTRYFPKGPIPLMMPPSGFGLSYNKPNNLPNADTIHIPTNRSEELHPRNKTKSNSNDKTNSNNKTVEAPHNYKDPNPIQQNTKCWNTYCRTNYSKTKFHN
jgi:hypothetical protein